MWNNLRVLDSHVHYAWPITPDSLTSILAKTDTDMACLAALPGCGRLNPTLDILAYKHRYPETTFAFGCLDCTAYGNKKNLGVFFIKEVKRLLSLGCDGLKLLEGKPTMRRMFDIPDFDDPQWEPFWAFAEECQLPILWHVNDPEIFWDAIRIPAFAKSAGWGYGPDDVNNEHQYRQVRTVMERHPQLNITFAHMFFLSAQLIRLSEWLERFPHMHVDLTPGIELYENLSNTPDDARMFFERFCSRILYGTDIGGRATLNGTIMKLDEKESTLRVRYERAFLTDKASVGIRSDGHFLVHSDPFVLHGLGLPDEMLQKILYANFISFVGCESPFPVNVDLCIKECAHIRRTLRAYASGLELAPDFRAVEADKRYFEKVKAESI
ncbi:MAG: amidohydrolase family protein [Clostridia bacterium]